MFIKYPLLLAYSIAQPVAAYTLVLFNYSSFKGNELRSEYMLGYMSLTFFMGGRLNSMAAYHVDDHKRFMTDLFTHILLLVNFVSMSVFLCKNSNSLANATFEACIFVACVFFGIMNFGKIYASMMASSFLDKGSSHLQKYMKTEHTESIEYDPVTLRGYNYLMGHPCDMSTTVSQVWLSNERLLGGSEGTQLKEVCLSFALFQLLRRRFFGVDCPEAKLPKTHDLIFKGLLINVEQNCQAYRIIEAELAFAHDNFFTISPFLHTELGQFNIFWSIGNVIFVYPLAVIMITIYLYSNKDVPMSPIKYSGDMPGGRVGLLISVITILLSFALELLQIYVHMSSDWIKVDVGLWSIHRKSSSFTILIYRYFHKLCRPFGHWQKKIGQHSLLKDLHSRSVTSFAVDVMGSLLSVFQRFLSYVPAFPRGIDHPGVKEPDLIPLTKDVKLAIAQTLIASNGKLSNGVSSLIRHNFSAFWACQQEIPVKNLLIWHIATEYCDIAQSFRTAELECLVLSHIVSSLPCFKKKQTVAREISKYCAYLMAFVPELLPDHHLETTRCFHEVRKDALNLLHEDRSLESKYIKMKSYDQQDETAFGLGIRLGKKLEEIEDDVRRWDILADLWAEMILYIAPSDNAKDHIQHLANGGEFLTHLWALLTHAGILERDHYDAATGQEAEKKLSIQNEQDNIKKYFENLSQIEEDRELAEKFQLQDQHREEEVPVDVLVQPNSLPPTVHGSVTSGQQSLEFILPSEAAALSNEHRIDLPQVSSSTQQAVP